MFNISDKSDKTKSGSSSDKSRQQNVDHLKVLVAEDDPVNSRIIQKRLEKSGHEVHHTVNGEDCASAYSNKASLFEVVLMDMQMPIVDGLTSTKMIRSYEKLHSRSNLSPRAQGNGRVPIFAVSASLVERELQTYIDAGFDGWILKPIDFKRLSILLQGIVDDDVRKSCLYKPGEWERGGWFQRQHPLALNSIPKPSGTSPVSMASGKKTSISSGESGSVTPKMEIAKPLVYDERLGDIRRIECKTSPPEVEVVDRSLKNVTDRPEA